MLVTDSVVDQLTDAGIDTVFGLPGNQMLQVTDEIDRRDGIEFVTARHETAVSHEAWGYAETSGRMAATAVVPGPGDMNALNGLKNARNDCTPLLHLSFETDPHLRGGDAIHEAPPDLYDKIVKHNTTVASPAAVPVAIARAVAVARTHPRGPVRVGIPGGFLSEEISSVDAGSFVTETNTELPSRELTEAAQLLADARAPLVIAGGGVRAANAESQLQRVATMLEAPVVVTRKGKGVFPENHGLFAGVMSPGTSDELGTLFSAADAALAVGTDFDAVTTRSWKFDVPDDLIHITAEPDHIGRGYPPAVGLVADANEALTELRARIDAEGTADSDGLARAARVREATAALQAELRAPEDPPLSSVAVLDAVRESLPPEAIVSIGGAGGFRLWAVAAFETYQPRTFVTCGSWASMGTGVPAAIGAKCANPDEDVVAITGDGNLLMCLQELHTAAAHDIPIVTVVLNNDDYGIISDTARRRTGSGGGFDWLDTPIDFSQVATGLGVAAECVETPQDIREAIERGLSADQPTLVEVPTDPQETQAKQFEPI